MTAKRVFLILLLCFMSLISAFTQDFYWENPLVLTKASPRFPVVKVDNKRAVIMWYEFTQPEEGDEHFSAFISFGYSEDGRQWAFEEKAIGPVQFTGEPSPFASIVFDSNTITIGYTSGSNSINIENKRFPLLADEEGSDELMVIDKGFKNVSTIYTQSPSVVPRLSKNASGGFLLFVTQETQVSDERIRGSGFGISLARSENGSEWTDFEPLIKQSGLHLNYLPSHTTVGGKDYVAFQVFTTGRNASNQLYLVSSGDSGISWTDPVIISEFTDTQLSSPRGVYDNQRPFLTNDGRNLYIAWERKAAGTTVATVYIGQLNADGTFAGPGPERVNRVTVAARNPEIFFLDSKPYILWFDNRAGDDHIILGWKQGIDYREWDLTRINGDSVFGEPIVLDDKLYIIWENRRDETSSIYLLMPDTTVPSPRLSSLNFTDFKAAKQDTFNIGWSIGQDSSGIAGYSFSWTKEPNKDPVLGRNPMVLNDTLSQTVRILEDGVWYFNIKAQDYAGNWSETARIRMVRDTTPPSPPVINVPQKDANGYLPSNTFSLTWSPPVEDDVAGYSYVMTYLAQKDYQGVIGEASIPKPSRQIRTFSPEMSFTNQDNGYWVISVSAIDNVGNVSEPASMFFRMDKYIPVTYITAINAETDLVGRINISLRGRGFTAEGKINTVILDRDGLVPWDYEFDSESFSIRNDRYIDDWMIEDIDEGAYRIGLVHPKRGLYLTSTKIELESSGTVKFGDFSYTPVSYWQALSDKLIVISYNSIVAVLLFIILGSALIFTIYRITVIMKESKQLEKEIEVFLTGRRRFELEDSKRIGLMKKKGIGLRLKFSLSITMLLTFVVLMVSVALGQYMMRSQSRSLAMGLLERSNVLLESLSTGTRAYLPGENILELALLPAQSEAMSDAEFVTITGAGSVDKSNYNYVWATNDQDFLATLDEGRISPGNTTINDTVAGETEKIKNEINAKAEGLSGISDEIKRIDDEIVRLAQVLALRPDDAEAKQTFDKLNLEKRNFEQQLNNRLKEIADVVNSYPTFDPEDVDLSIDQYIFYKPVVYRSNADELFFRSIIRLGVSTNGIRRELNIAQRTLIRITVIISLIAALIGVIGALVLATIIIIPIRRLVEGVEKIRDTEDKEELYNHIINTKTKDELASLADTINDMTKGLVKAAQASKELTVGKEVQKMFLPLEKNTEGKKTSTARENNSDIELFGYYEGAKGVSGDYFDYIKLDESHYAVILCDVAGKGVPASLIMVEVATIFLNYFKTVLAQNSKASLTELVYSINDLVEERGFQGRFAALILGLVDIKSGKFTMCNAGYKFVQLYSAEKREMWSKTLNEAPATGVFPNFMVDMKGGFIEIEEKLKKDDCVFLFSDGIEEAQRKFRNSDFEIIKCNEQGMKDGDIHDTHNFGTNNEEFSNSRIHEIINAVFNRRKYSLKKYHNPIPDETLTFDFTSCDGTMEEAVIAMVAVERVFRINPDPSAKETDRIAIDIKINEFLKEYFVEYSRYFHSPVVGQKNAEYIQFGFLKEDEQYDDLTILGIRKR